MEETGKVRRRRNWLSFWIFGLCNNFAFNVMLSAAHDIIADYANKETNHTTSRNSSSNMLPVLHSTTETPGDSEYLYCNPISTGVILMAGIFPSLTIKVFFPFFIEKAPYCVRVTMTALFSALSLIIVSFAPQMWLSIVGVVCSSISMAVGETSFLPMCTFYDKDVVSTWSSGTGASGLLAPLLYSGLTSAGVSPRNALLFMLTVPTCMMLTYKFLLVEESQSQSAENGVAHISNDESLTVLEQKKTNKNFLTLRAKILLMPSMAKYMVPLAAVYFAKYYINQGLLELLYFNGQFLSKEEQYRWYQTAFGLGVFIARSSGSFFIVRRLWILPILQFANVILFLLHVLYQFIPSLWIVLAVVFWEGLIGGEAYVSTFYLMNIELPKDVREYCMALATLSDGVGISLAGISAVPTHNEICSLRLKM